MNPLCIYHGACDDGFGAAWAVRRELGVNVDFYPGVYQKDPPDVAGRDVIMVDFSYKRPVLDKMAAVARSILILDHHKTAAEDLADVPVAQAYDIWDRPKGMSAIFDMNRSGAGLAWDYFQPMTARLRFIDYLEDRDLWRKLLPGGDEFTICLRSYPQDFDVWDSLVARGVDDMIAEGRSIQRYYRQKIEEMKAHAYLSHLAGVPCAIANAPYFAASELAGELCDRPGAIFGACYFEVEKGRFQYSLRSRSDFDVSTIAKAFGGGGHKGAAGFSTAGTVHEMRGVLGALPR
jgi:oligoribonuclease NrnB/cAMP/cGMP phosphodiesterase (DHH superfamily)